MHKVTGFNGFQRHCSMWLANTQIHTHRAVEQYAVIQMLFYCCFHSTKVLKCFAFVYVQNLLLTLLINILFLATVNSLSLVA